MASAGKNPSRKDQERLRGALMQHWDPIGIAREPGAWDEYDDYIHEIYVLLTEQNASQAAIKAHLLDIDVKCMGLRNLAFITERSDRAAAVLVGLRPELDTH
jgi:hypothetical protein